MFKNKLFILMCFSHLILGCATTKTAVDTEDEWKSIGFIDEILGEWQGAIFLSGGGIVYLNLSFFIDNNKDCIFTVIANFEPMLDKHIYDLEINHKGHITKDEIWELVLSKDYNFKNKDKFEYFSGKYYIKATAIFLSSEKINKELEEDKRASINQFGNKLKFSEVSGIEGGEIIYKKYQ